MEVALTVDNTARDHRLRLRLPTGAGHGRSVAETAFGEIARDADAATGGGGWAERPTGQQVLRRYAAVEDGHGGLQVLTEGLHEYAIASTPHGRTLDVTLLRAVGWLARTDTPGRERKVGPEVEVPAAQCPGPHTFRLALRPLRPGEHAGHRLRAAEEFSTPLLGAAVQGARRADRATTAPGVTITPATVALTAFKVAEDGDGVVLRVVNAGADPVAATLTVPGATRARACDLEERPTEELDVTDGRIAMTLPAGRIATVRVPS